MAFDDDLIDKDPVSRLKQRFYNEIVSKHDYQYFGKNSLGASVEHDHVHEAIFEIVKESGKVEVVDGNIRNIIPAKDINTLSTIELEDGRILKTRLIIGNDGENSYVREAHDIESTSHPYGQQCITKTLIHDSPLNG